MHTCNSAQIGWLLGLIWIAIGAIASVARGEALFVRGAVSGEWIAPIDTVVIDSFAWIPQAETLRIAPGMVVAITGRFSLVVNGTLLANGTSEDSVRVQRTPYHGSDGHLGIRFRNTTTVSKLNCVVIEDGFANSGNEERYGGALELFNAEVEIDSCSLRGNRARIDGGAIYCREGATLTVRDSEFSGDSTRVGGGGAILARTSGSVTLERCRFINNKSFTSGGAISIEAGVTPRIEACFFANDIALQRGGAVQLRSSPAAGYMRNCVIETCTADLGGGLYLDNTRSSVQGCSVRVCTARLGGGIAARGSNNTAPISQMVVNGNFAAEDGGGFHFVESARCVMSNSILVGNTATRGGAAYCAATSAPVFRFVTMLGNTGFEGSAISFAGAGTLTNSIVTGDDSLLSFEESAAPQISFSNIYSDEGNELAGAIPAGLLSESRLNVALVACDSLRNISRNPEFVDIESGDYRLSDTSPCLFGADTSRANGNDFAGNPRVAPVGSWPDMGAFESTALLPHSGNCGSKSGVWYPGDYVIGCTLRVERQDTLVIMAGSRLLFAPGASLYIEGKLFAFGTERDSIIFDRYFELPGSTWGGITIDGSSGSLFEYCSIQRVMGNSAVAVMDSRAEFSHCTFSDNSNPNGQGALTTGIHGYAQIQACRFTGNTATIGAALCLTESNSSVHDSYFENNLAIVGNDNSLGMGGAIYANFAEISNCEFRRDSALAGGAIFAVGCEISNCVIDSCYATYGGGLFLPSSLTTIRQTQFRHNSAKAIGGAIGTYGGSVLDHGSTYSENHALMGGAISLSRGTYTGDSVLFNNNFADSAGGAIWLDHLVTGTLNFCTFTRNHSLCGGAVYSDSAEIRIEHGLLDSNYSVRMGGGIYLDGGEASILKSTCVNHSSENVGSVIFAEENSVVSANSVLFADNGEIPVLISDLHAREFNFCMSDEPFGNMLEPFGLPMTVNFNGDSCDTRMNLIAEPEFTNAGQRDYHVQSSSRAIHAADSLLPLDEDGTRADIGLYSGVRPYHLPQPFNLTHPERDASFHPEDSIVFAWNEARDDDPGDVVRYSLRLVANGIDSTIEAHTDRSVTLQLLNGEYTWWVEAQSLRPEDRRESFERREFVVADPALDADTGVLPREFGVRLTGPNPFNNSTQLELALPYSADVSMAMHDVLGREAMRIERNYAAGTHTITVEGSMLSSGVSWMSVRAGDELARVKVMLVK